MQSAPSSFLGRNEFLIRRLHSLCGLVPVGAYMVIHLVTNATVIESSEKFQIAVYAIHSLGSLLPVVEWGFIFIPLLFHAIFGVVIIKGGLPNTTSYAYASNYRYTLQRVSGMVAFVFIMWHVFHMHGWIHADWWINNVAKPYGGAQFSPYNASSSASAALQDGLVAILYAVGVIACVFHLANGIWTMGITWGVWVSPAAQRRANFVCIAFGILLGIVGLSALNGMRDLDYDEAVQGENQLYNSKIESGEIKPSPHKRSEDPIQKILNGDEGEPSPQADVESTNLVPMLKEIRFSSNSARAKKSERSTMVVPHIVIEEEPEIPFGLGSPEEPEAAADGTAPKD